MREVERHSPSHTPRTPQPAAMNGDDGALAARVELLQALLELEREAEVRVVPLFR